jgi:hypothetical protein
VHIDAAHNIAMALKTTFPAFPHSAPGPVSMLAYRTLAARSSFRASEALDAGLFTLVGQIVDILAVLPLGHALVVMASSVLLPHPVQVADEERLDLLLFAKVDYLPGCLVAQIAHTPFGTACHFILGVLQLPPSAGVLLTAGLLFGKLSMSHVALALETANATT